LLHAFQAAGRVATYKGSIANLGLSAKSSPLDQAV
jgi:hypothetical protein